MEQKKSVRMANMELLRIISMMLVIVLHFLNKGNNLTDLTKPGSNAYTYVVWTLESLSIVAVNVYMLISGYFLVESSFKVKRLLSLLLQVLFYSVGVGAVAACFGLVPAEGVSVYYLLQLCLPVSKNQYWFVTAYVLMYLLAPLLAAGVKRLTKRQFQIVLALVLFWFSILKSVIPFRFETDAMGYDCLWYVCVFLVAAYIRLYGIPFFGKKSRCLAGYVLGCGGILIVTFALRFVFLQTGKLRDMLTMCFEYNHILVLFAAVAFFYLFLHIQIADGWFGRMICFLSPYTFGVYLLHEHIAIRYEWPDWLYLLTGKPSGIGSLFAITLAAVLFVFVAGVFVDFIRNLLFKLCHKLLMQMKAFRKLDAWLNTLVIPTSGLEAE